jgi:hypothetical protein
VVLVAGWIHLEDTWGRAIYPVFYLFVAGAAAMQFYAWCTPGSFVPLVGASGAVRNARCACRAGANEAIERELGWRSNPDIVSASDAMEEVV